MKTDYNKLTNFLKFYNALKIKYTGEPYQLNNENMQALKQKFQTK